MLLERLQVTLGLKNPCNLCGALSNLGSVGHDRVSHPTKAARSRQLRWQVHEQDSHLRLSYFNSEGIWLRCKY